MDLISLGFYAAICGVLSAASPAFCGFIIRFGIGIAVGAGAALLLPMLKVALGSGY